MISETSRVITKTIKLQFKQSFSRSMFKFIILLSPIFSGLLYGYIYKGHSCKDFVSFVMIGTATTTMWNSILFSSAGDINRERFMGALHQIFLSPAKFYYIMIGKVIANTIIGTFSMIYSFIFVKLFFHIDVKFDNLTLFIITSIILIISYIVIGLLLSGLLAISRQTRVLMNCMTFPILILTGSVFPLTEVPLYIRWIGYLLSPTYAIKILRNQGHIFTNLILLIILTLIYTVLSILFYHFIEIKVRETATLELY